LISGSKVLLEILQLAGISAVGVKLPVSKGAALATYLLLKNPLPNEQTVFAHIAESCAIV